MPLVVLQVSVGLLALLGSGQILTDGLGLDPAWLRRTPFPDWTLPALALMLLPGAGELVAAACSDGARQADPLCCRGRDGKPPRRWCTVSGRR